MLHATNVNRATCLAAARDPALLATDLADYLVLKGVAFRQAHHAVGALVAQAERLDKPLDQLSIEELKSVDPRFEPDALKLFNLKWAMARRKIHGAPGTAEVRRQLARWRRALKRVPASNSL
jgi:argininosuccinate lyase